METHGAPAAPLSDPLSAESKSTQLQQSISMGANPVVSSIEFLSAESKSPQIKQSTSVGANLGISSVEIGSKQGIMSTTSSTAVSESPRVSKMVKSGLNFVIPKNKLLGAMVPVNRSATKWEPLDSKKEELKPPARKTNWGPDLAQESGVKKGRALALQTRAEQLAAQLESGNLDIDSNEDTRSPSPPPLYDTLGHRMNTREVRKREQLDLERREAIGECMKLNSVYKPPSGYKPVTKEAKLYIPVKENPGYNFIGLILGPRGNTQKRMEAETGAKITIRGKGAVKEGKMQAARNGKDMDGATEELHVHISADTFEKVDAAVALIEPLLTPVDEDRNMHKMKQLRELAEMNGTLNDFTRACGVCGEAGHREWQCSKEQLQNFQANVRCHICGDGGHPTVDCPRKNFGQGPTFDKEYLNFLEELGTGLEGVGTSMVAEQLSRPTASQPMLLTTLGAQPIPARWMAPPLGSNSSAVSTPRGPQDGTNNTGPFPRFPAPPTSQGAITFNHFVPRFFQPIGVVSGPIRSQPFPGPTMPMMIPAFRGQSPSSPAGLPSSMFSSARPEPNSGILPHSSNSQMPGQAQAFGPATDVTFSGNSDLLSGSQPASVTQAGGLNAPAFSLSSAANSFPSTGTFNINLQFQSSASCPLPTASPVATSVQSLSTMSVSNLLPVDSTHPVLPLAPPRAATSSQLIMHPTRPVVPSIRPAVPASIAHGPNLAGPLLGPGQTLPSGVPSLGGTGNVAPPAANIAFPGPPQPVSGTGTLWGPQGQYPGPRPSQRVALPFDGPPPAAIPPLPQPPVNTQPLQAPMRSAPPMPMAAGQGGMRAAPVAILPPLTSSFTPFPAQGQLVINPNNQLASQSSSHTSSRPSFPPPSHGSQIRAHVSLPGGRIPLVPASMQQMAIPQDNNAFRPPQGFPRSAVLQNTQFAHQGNGCLPRAEFPPPQPGHVGAQIRAEFGNRGLHQQGILVSPSILGSPALSRPLLGAPQEALNRAHNPNFPGPAHTMSSFPNFTGNMGAVTASWDPHRNRPDMQQMNLRPAMAGNKGWNADPRMGPQSLHVPRPQMQDVDPEYEKLMASVGVL